jgi:NAD(P)-dependent dehydrogenase (short-subunit alcohol dehydrogenase family)
MADDCRHSRLLSGTVTLVAGVGPGLGAHVARDAVAAGGRVVLGARSDACGPDHVRELGDEHATFVPLDVTDAESCRRWIDVGLERFGRADALVVNAMTTRQATLIGGDLGAWRASMEVNLFGALEITRAAVPALLRSPAGSIVFVGSQIVRRVFPGRGPYAASKAALVAAGHVIAAELGPLGVRVNTLVPGRMWGAPLQSAVSRLADERGTTEETEVQAWIDATALRRLATDEECARVVTFLNSHLAAAITGQTIDANAGETMR